ncbi:MAG: hypothetical protein U5K75_12140 [Ahrensia sp.]|nr:hypothetical protein [Ahrensia sp.]
MIEIVLQQQVYLNPDGTLNDSGYALLLSYAAKIKELEDRIKLLENP